MAENEQERTATEMASQAINAMNPNALELRNAAAGGVPDVHEAASKIQDQMKSGEDPQGAVADVLGGGGGEEPTQTAGGAMQQAGQQALNATKSLVERARDFAVEFSEQLWGGDAKEKDKI